jgi:hypothetical protein
MNQGVKSQLLVVMVYAISAIAELILELAFFWEPKF